MNEGGFLIEKDFAEERDKIINAFKIPSLMLRKKIKGESDQVYGRRILNQFLITLSMDLSNYDMP